MTGETSQRKGQCDASTEAIGDPSHLESQNKPWLHRWLESVWYDGSLGKYLLVPLTPLFYVIARTRRWQQECQRSEKPAVPVIVVGNITVGGTGKTPLVIKIANLLKEAGYSPGIISRGYKGTSKDWPQRVIPSTPPHLVGDEPVLMAARTGVPVVTGPNRNVDIRCLLNHNKCDVIISDDGLQHYKMPRSVEIVVVDADRRFGNGWCLPAGPLRERIARIKESQFCVINGNLAEDAHEGEYLMQLKGSTLVNLTNANKISLSQIKGQKVHAVTGIGNPERFFTTLRNAGLEVIPHSFTDHHNFQKDDLLFDNDYPVIITEKDAVKCRKFQTSNCWYLPVQAELNNGFDKALLDCVKSLS